MRRYFMLLILLLALPTLAQDPPPKGLQPLPEVPPPPAQEIDPELEPQVTIIKRGEDTIEEFRVHGKLYMIKVTPAIGAPYFLIDEHGQGQFVRQDHFDSGLRVPQWVIFEF